MDPRERLIEAIEDYIADPDEHAARALAEAREAARALPEAAAEVRAATAILEGATPSLPEDARFDVLLAVAEQEVLGNHRPEEGPLFRWLEEHEPDYRAIRDAVARATRAHAMHAAEEEPLDDELARSLALGALAPEVTTALCDRVDRDEAAVVEPLRRVLAREPHLLDTRDILAEDPPRLHRWRLAWTLRRLAHASGLRAAADTPVRVRVLDGDEPVHDGALSLAEDEPLIGADRPVHLDLGEIPGSEAWTGRRVSLHMGEGTRVLGTGTVGPDGVVPLVATGMLAELAASLPGGALDLRHFFGDGRSRLAMVVRVRR